MRASRNAAIIAVTVLSIALRVGLASSEPAVPVAAHNVVLVNGPSTGNARWESVIRLLEAAGLRVTVAENATASLRGSVAETRRILVQQDGPVVLVGHSWSGDVVSEAGDDPKVSALVYVAATAREVGEHFVKLLDPNQEVYQSATIETTRAAAWREKPSFYAISKEDRTLLPRLEHFFAKRMKAKTIELDAGHLSMVSHPREIAGLILEAAGMRPPACDAADDDGVGACAAPALPRSVADGCKCTKTPPEDLTAP